MNDELTPQERVLAAQEDLALTQEHLYHIDRMKLYGERAMAESKRRLKVAMKEAYGVQPEEADHDTKEH